MHIGHFAQSSNFMKCSTTVPVVVIAAALAALATITACGNSANVSTVAGPSIVRCGISVTGAGSSAPAAGGTGTLTVSAARECAWSARSESLWISLSSTQGQGPLTLTYSVLPNPDGTSRRGNVVIDDQRVEISQEPAPCRYAVSPSSAELAASGGTIDLDVATPGGCAWRTESSEAWLSPEPLTGAGAATVRINAAPNTGPPRTGNITLGGVSVVLRQDGPSTTPPPTCSYQIAPGRQATPAAGESFTLSVTAPAGCTWMARSEMAWVTVMEGGAGIGSGAVRLQVQPNNSAARSGTVRLATETLTIDQGSGTSPPPPCGQSEIKPTYYNAGRGPDDVRVEVRSTNGCPWTVISTASWVSVSEGSSGSGNGSVRLLVQANAGGPRTTTLSVAGQPFTLSQEGSCEATVKPTYYNAGAGPDDVRVRVTVGSSCSWTSSSPVTWARIIEGAAQSGDGDVRIRIDPNAGGLRSATLMIAGQPFTLTQEAPRR